MYAPEGGEPGWYTFDHRPRFNNNYVGLRNRIALLSEAYSYASFEERVATTLVFVEGILDLAAAHGDRVRQVTGAADRAPLAGGRLPLRARVRRGPEVEILMGAAEERLNPISGRRYLARLPVVELRRMRDYTAFEGFELERVPSAYYVPPGLKGVIDRLAIHGVRTERLPADRAVRVERFVLDSTRVAEREFQGHREREVFGAWAGWKRRSPAEPSSCPRISPSDGSPSTCSSPGRTTGC